MKDWKALSSALGLNIPEQDLEKIRGPLDVLEASFRPLVASLPVETEPAYVVQLNEEP